MNIPSRLFLLGLFSLGISATAGAEELLICEQVLDFETDASGAPIVAGQDLAEVYADYGVHLQTFNSMAMVDGRGVAFDSSNPPDHDLDLGTPNESYGGPGVSTDGGGASNSVALGNLLISAENFTDADGDGILDDPDDDAAGAWFDWHFDTPICVTGLDLVDIESSEGPADLIFYDADGNTLDWIQAGGLGDNSVEHVDLLVCGVSSALFDLYGSGAVDNLSYCLPTDTCVVPAEPDPLYSSSSITHSMWMPGIATDLVFEPDPAHFLEFIDGTAVLTGTAYSASDPAKGFEVSIQLSGATTTPSADGPKMSLSSSAYVPYGPVDTSTWYYYSDFSGVLTGVGDYAGASVAISPRGPYFQVGDGANDKNTGYGASGWFYYDVLDQPDAGSFPSSGNGDINVDLVDCDGAAEEVCDDLDNDGDGFVDEGFEDDADGDGIYDCLDAEECDGADNDGDSSVDEGLPDADRDGICDALDDEVCDLNDNDGDGQIDEGLPDADGDGRCDALDSEDCDGVDNDGDYSIDEGFDSDGDGLANCYDDEECDGADNDGDGLTDEGFDADGDGLADCFDGEDCDDLDNDGDGGVDEGFDSDGDGVADCFDVEDCDGLDNDGDMAVDEGLADTDGDGVCDGIDGEECDGADNDGDGSVDEGFDADGDGTPDCLDVEECDGLDNDGDRTVDEGFDSDSDGTADCFDAEVCDGADNDGDGAVDEGSGDSDLDGVLDCFDSEDCDGVDNDGDGSVDEGLPDGDGDGLCDSRDSEECDGVDNDGDGSIDEGFDVDGDGLADCFDPEACDGVDNDGDGVTDEGFDSDGDGVADCFDGEDCDGLDNDGDGLVDEGLDSDHDGTANCFDTEECDFLDNDGDGLVDEALPDTDMDGVCDGRDAEECDGLDNDGDGGVDEGFDSDSDGTADCFDVEECDGLDNNGNGVIDEGFDFDGDGVANCFDVEECDGFDNDGDGAVDEDTSDIDGDGIADCSDSETCDGLDNDGDGAVDEDTSDIDGDGIADCFDQETCDAVDNDGDGQVDEGFDIDSDGLADCFDTEDCDLRDNDGDGLVDEGLADCDTCPDPVVVSIGYASDYNVVSFGDYTGGLDVAGKVAVDGDAWFSNFSVGAGTTGGDVLIASGALDLSFGTVHGNAVYGTTYAEDTVGYNNGGAPRLDSPVDFAAMEAEAIAAAASLQTLTVNGTAIVQDWGEIDLTGTSETLNVFALTCDELAAAPTLSLDAPAGSTAVVNVSGSSCSLESLYIALSGVDRTDVLFNLYEASTLTIENVSMQGSVLAPYAATVFNNGNFQGTLITAELAGDGEFHDYPFDGQIVECPEAADDGGSCTYIYTETNAWEVGGGEGFQAEVSFTWYGGAVDGWTLEWDFAGDELISSGWSGVFSQTDAHVSVTDEGWNAILEDGSSASVGFTATRSTASAAPGGFTLNGVSCSEDTGGFE